LKLKLTPEYDVQVKRLKRRRNLRRYGGGVMNDSFNLNSGAQGGGVGGELESPLPNVIDIDNTLTTTNGVDSDNNSTVVVSSTTIVAPTSATSANPSVNEKGAKLSKRPSVISKVASGVITGGKGVANGVVAGGMGVVAGGMGVVGGVVAGGMEIGGVAAGLVGMNSNSKYIGKDASLHVRLQFDYAVWGEIVSQYVWEEDPVQ
jgi:hypothetical protein